MAAAGNAHSEALSGLSATVCPEDIELYRALLAGPATAADLAAALRIDERSHLEQGLERLAVLRLIRPSPLERTAFEAVSPDLAAAELVADLEAHAHALLRQSTSVRSELGGLAPLYDQSRRDRLTQGESEVVTDSESVRRRLQEVATQARTSVIAAHPTMAGPEALAAGLALDATLLTRGVEYRIVFPHVALRQQHGRDHIAALRGLGADIRTAAMVPARLLIVDGEVSVIPLQPGRGPGAAIVTDPSVIAFLTGIFEHTWDRARLIENESLPDELFEEVELAILTELASGRTDESIARRLGISTRTLRRYLTSISEQLGVETRFQMGVAAYAAGLIRPEKH